MTNFARFTLSLCLLGWIAIANARAGTAPISTRPILFLHGYSVFGLGINCSWEFGTMKEKLKALGFQGPMVTIGYYSNDGECDAQTSDDSSILTPIADLSHDLAWYVYDHYSAKGVAVDVVGHSMGALMIRYALYRIATSDPAYPPYLRVAHVSALGAPFEGYSLLAESCHLVVVNAQCDDMAPYSDFIAELQNPAALVPQGKGGTVWGNVGSAADIFSLSDGVVGQDSATSMKIPDSAKILIPWYRFVFHTFYNSNDGVIGAVATQLSDGVLHPEGAYTPSDGTRFGSLAARRADAEVGREELRFRKSSARDQTAPARMSAYFENDVRAGVKFSDVAPGSVFAKMGIQSDDVIRGCGPSDVNAPFDALAALEKSAKPVTLDFCILRDGKTITRRVVVR